MKSEGGLRVKQEAGHKPWLRRVKRKCLRGRQTRVELTWNEDTRSRKKKTRQEETEKSVQLRKSDDFSEIRVKIISISNTNDADRI